MKRQKAKLDVQAGAVSIVSMRLATGTGTGIVDTMNLLDRITIEPGKCGGRPCIRNFRLRVRDVLELIAAGATREEILEDYPFLEPEDITAALLCSTSQTDHIA